MAKIREQLQADVRRDVTQLLSERLARSEETRDSLQARLDEMARSEQQARALAPAVLAELRAQQPDVQAATLAQGRRIEAVAAPASAASAPTPVDVVVVVLDVARALGPEDRQRLAAWLALRLGTARVDLIERVTTEPAARRPR